MDSPLPEFVDGPYLTVGVFAGIYAIAASGTALLLGRGGVASIGQAGFLAAGAYTSAILVVRHGWNQALAAVAAMAIAAVFGLVVGLTLLRLRGHYVTLATLAVGIVIGVAANELAFTGGTTGIYGVPKPVIGLHSYFDAPSYFRLVWPFALLCALVCTLAIRGRAGRALLAARDSEIAARTLGVRISRQRLAVFVVAAALAGLSGSFYVYWASIVTPQASGVILSAEILVMAVIGGATPYGAVLGAVFVEVFQQVLTDTIPHLVPGASGEFQLVGLGIVLTVVAIANPGDLAVRVRARLTRVRPGGAASADDEKRARFPGEPRGEPIERLAGGARAAEPMGVDGSVPGAVNLNVAGVSRRFGGLQAVDDVSFRIPTGEVLGLIGPNGAGKTTLFNIISGVVSRDQGTVTIGQTQVRTPEQLARLGGARTFQNLELFGSMTVLENVLVGCHRHGQAGLLVAATGFADRREERALYRRVERLLSLFGLRDVADVRVGDLPFGRQRLVEIARAMAVSPELLLLDEPMAGLSHSERRELGQRIGEIARHGCAVLLVEHDVEAVLGLSHRVAVLDQGRLIALATPAEVRADPAVITAYLGDDGPTPEIPRRVKT